MPTPDIVIETLRGGYNDSDPPNALDQDQCTVALNVEWFYSTLGERRLGGQPFDLTGSSIASDTEVVFAVRHFPDRNEVDNELWVVSAVPNTSVRVSRRTADGTWSTVTPAVSIDPSTPDVYQMSGISFDSKLYLCAHLVGNLDRILVWDGTSLRLVGFAQPVAPVVTNTGVGTYSVVRYFRVRYAQLNGSTIIRQSEPSDSTTFTPSGTGAGALITKPAALNEGETHWLVEASYDNANFYKIATVPVGTTTYTDTTPSTTTYASEGELSADIGEYAPIPSSRFITVDDDRVVVGGSFIDDNQSCRVGWTPVRNDPGVGNSERIPANTDNTTILDAQAGGGLTGLSRAANGSWYAFKWSRVYSMTRTGIAASAYAVLTLSDARGALQGSVVSGLDEMGRPCVYFADPHTGPTRVGAAGIQAILGLRRTWGRVNANAAKGAIRGIYYPYKQQMWWMVAVDGAQAPTLGLKLQVNELRETTGGVRRGWSFFDGLLPTALAATLLTEVFQAPDGSTYLSTRPILGYTGGSFLLRSDLGDTDGPSSSYISRVRTRPLFQAGLISNWGSRIAALLAHAATTTMQVAFLRNYGLETNLVIVDLSPEATEDYVIKVLDNLVMSEMTALQVEFSDQMDPRQKVGYLYHSEIGE